MSGHQNATVEDTVYFWFGANDTSGSGGDGSTPLFDVREAGAAASAAPLLSGTPDLLSHANYPAGCYEVAVDATVANGFAADDTFAVFCTLLIDSQNPTGFVGSCTLTPLATAATASAILTDTGTTIPGLISNLQGATVTKNAAFSDFEFVMKLTSDHYTAATSKTVTGERSIDGGAFASVSGTIAEVSAGVYQFDALAADTNGDSICWKFSATDCDDTIVTFKTSV